MVLLLTGNTLAKVLASLITVEVASLDKELEDWEIDKDYHADCMKGLANLNPTYLNYMVEQQITNLDMNLGDYIKSIGA